MIKYLMKKKSNEMSNEKKFTQLRMTNCEMKKNHSPKRNVSKKSSHVKLMKYGMRIFCKLLRHKSMCLCKYVYVSVCVHLSLCLVCLSVYLYLSVYFCLYIHLYILLCLSIHLSLSVFISVLLSMYLSKSLGFACFYVFLHFMLFCFMLSFFTTSYIFVSYLHIYLPYSTHQHFLKLQFKYIEIRCLETDQIVFDNK